MIVQYRGSLKSCNYTCAYCPFSKRKGSLKEREKDKNALFRFYDSLKDETWGRRTRQVEALQIVPYGEAMQQTYYWEFLAKVSQIETIQAVGIQTNLSFSPEAFLTAWRQWGGITEKLRIWATFHPSMVQMDSFVRTVTCLQKEGIGICVGVVGVPKQIETFRTLKALLPEGVTFWINALEGKKGPYIYKKEEMLQFQALDKTFAWEMKHWTADVSLCQNRCFVEADGTMYRCNISRTVIGDWYQPETMEAEILASDGTEKPSCQRRECSCFLAYSGRSDFSPEKQFGEFPMFRIISYVR